MAAEYKIQLMNVIAVPYLGESDEDFYTSYFYETVGVAR